MSVTTCSSFSQDQWLLPRLENTQQRNNQRHVPATSLFNSLCLVPVTFLQHVCELLKLLQIEILLLNLLVEGFDLFLEWEISVLKFACDRMESIQNHVSGICSKQYFWSIDECKIYMRCWVFSHTFISCVCVCKSYKKETTLQVHVEAWKLMN